MSATDWAGRAASLYDDDYARRYRDRDEQLQATPSNQALLDWLGGVCDRFARPIDVLDLGCGTGRYFWGLRHVAIHAERLAWPITLVPGDLMTHTFADASFDLVYSIGVLAEHVPLDSALVARVHGWLKPGGRFAFTTVHPASPSVPKTAGRRLAALALAVAPAAATTPLHRRYVTGGRYADERWITSVLADRFTIEFLDRFTTDVHLHGRCVARKAA
jgi:SAM-dependent methyltransferase